MKINPNVQQSDAILRDVEDLEKEIRSKAHAKFHLRGETSGDALQDWLAAEAEVTSNISLQLTESNDTFHAVLHVPTPDAPAVLVSGDTILIRTAKPKGVFRHFRISGKIDPRSVRANFAKEELHVTGTFTAGKAAHIQAMAS
jgi:hypothetical protein